MMTKREGQCLSPPVLHDSVTDSVCLHQIWRQCVADNVCLHQYGDSVWRTMSVFASMVTMCGRQYGDNVWRTMPVFTSMVAMCGREYGCNVWRTMSVFTNEYGSDTSQTQRCHLVRVCVGGWVEGGGGLLCFQLVKVC